MLDAYRRGAMTAYDVFCVLKREALLPLAPEPQEVGLLASRVYRDLKKQGYAHLEPQEHFLSGFVTRFLRALSDEYYPT